jgi:hypothetical protein
MKIARISSGLFKESSYPCVFDWPDDCFCQGGGDGLVFENTTISEAFENPTEYIDLKESLTNDRPEVKPNVKVRRTAFFEAFPRNPNTFIRGEGETIAAAEESCWRQYQKTLQCAEHEFERRGRTDGYCYCKHCNLSGTFMEPTTHCCKCGIPAAYGSDKYGKIHCETHYKDIPPEDLNEAMKRLLGLYGETD